MRRTDYQGMCELVKDGHMAWVENTHTNEKGRVISCGSDSIEVEVGDHCETWDRRECREMTHGYKMDYDEVKKHPHEFDTHHD